MIDTFGKLPPQAIDLEKAVLGAILLEPVFSKVAETLKDDDFYLPQHQEIYKAFLQLFIKRTPIDVLTVAEQLKSTGHLEDAGGIYELSQLTNAIASFKLGSLVSNGCSYVVW
jgi:replicative DNA helicase